MGSVKVCKSDGSTVRQDTITSNEDEVGRLIAEGRVRERDRMAALVDMYRRQVAAVTTQRDAAWREMSRRRMNA